MKPSRIDEILAMDEYPVALFFCQHQAMKARLPWSGHLSANSSKDETGFGE